ncbi:MAG: hypothetical protein AAGM22_12505 [Acidobacteriota bacterium]
MTRPTSSDIHLSSKTEARHESLQVQLLIALTLGAGGSFLEELARTLGQGFVESVASTAAMVGWFATLLVFFRMWQLGTLDREGQYLRGAVDDERGRSLRLRAVYFAFVAMLVVQLGLELAAAVLESQGGPMLGARLAANLTFATGVIASLGGFLYLDRFH